jgi:hypothetical protein
MRKRPPHEAIALAGKAAFVITRQQKTRQADQHIFMN